METMSLVGYKIGYIVNFVPNPDWHLDSKWRSRNRGGGRDLKKLSFRFLFKEKVETIGVFAAAFSGRVSGEK